MKTKNVQRLEKFISSKKSFSLYYTIPIHIYKKIPNMALSNSRFVLISFSNFRSNIVCIVAL